MSDVLKLATILTVFDNISCYQNVSVWVCFWSISETVEPADHKLWPMCNTWINLTRNQFYIIFSEISNLLVIGSNHFQKSSHTIKTNYDIISILTCAIAINAVSEDLRVWEFSRFLNSLEFVFLIFSLPYLKYILYLII